jgi:hypothetical protein
MKARYLLLMISVMVMPALWVVSSFGGIGPVLDKVTPSIAYDAQNSRYLVAYEKEITFAAAERIAWHEPPRPAVRASGCLWC